MQKSQLTDAFCAFSTSDCFNSDDDAVQGYNKFSKYVKKKKS